jgi:hypothetical protein
MIRMVGGKGKGKRNVVSLVVDAMRARCAKAEEADAVIEAFLRGDPMSEADRRLVVDALVACEARVRSGEVLLQRESDSSGNGMEGQ